MTRRLPNANFQAILLGLDVEAPMPIYELIPIDEFQHVGWRGSSHKDACLVHAPDVPSARLFAARTFSQELLSSSDKGGAAPPWLTDEAVKCEVLEGSHTQEYVEGRILISLHGGGNIVTSGYSTGKEWKVAEEGKVPDPPPEFGGNYGEQTLPSVRSGGLKVEAEGVVVNPAPAELGITGYAPTVKITHPITQKTVNHVVNSREVIRPHVLVLLDLLREDEAAAGANYRLTDALGLAGRPDEDDLLEVLHELRDELRRFNQGLENAKLDQSALVRLRDIGLKYLDGVVNHPITRGAGAAALSVILWNTLVHAGLIESEAAVKLLKALGLLG